jgi:hypothetical protein
MDRVVEAFNLRLEAAATPERVAAAATFLKNVLDAAHPNLPDGSITMVVTNLNMGTHVRPRTAEGRKATNRILQFLENPARVLGRDPTSRGIAAAFASANHILREASIFRPRGRTPLATFNETFTKQMGALAASTKAEQALRGTTIVYSPVYRVGRSDEDRATKVRIRLDGECHEITLLDQESAMDFYTAAPLKRTFPIYLNAVWNRGVDGRLYYDVGATRAVRVDLKWEPVTGAEFVAAIDSAVPSGYADEDDIEERIELIRQRRT